MSLSARPFSCLAFFLLAILLWPNFAAAVDLTVKQQKLAKSIEQSARVQAQLDSWNQEKAHIMDEMRQLKARLTWVEFQVAKNQRYIQRKKEQIRSLQEQMTRLEQIRYKLEPWMEQIYNRLLEEIDQRPFLIHEREQRMARLRNTLDDPDKGLGEKLSHLLEVVQIEAAYTSLMETRTATLQIHGEQQEVTILQLGRVTMFYLTKDGTAAGRYDFQAAKWRPLGPGHEAAIKKGIEIVENKRVAELVELPVGRLNP